jgi:hypothetical protein
LFCQENVACHVKLLVLAVGSTFHHRSTVAAEANQTFAGRRGNSSIELKQSSNPAEHQHSVLGSAVAAENDRTMAAASGRHTRTVTRTKAQT